MSKVPIALFAYARPYHLKNTLEGLKINKVPLIYAFCDGAKKADDLNAIEQVRGLIHEVDWCDLVFHAKDNNIGLGASIRSGVSRVLEDHDKVIVVEDDIVLRPGAYKYVTAALDYYERDPRVMTISMWSFPSIVPKKSQNGFFSKRFSSWGWATYRNHWEKYRELPIDIYQMCEKQNTSFLNWGKDLKWQADHAEERNLWYVGYALIHFLHDCVSYFPNKSLVVNIGRDGTGENIGSGSRRRKENFRLINRKVSFPEEWPSISIAKNLDKKYSSYFTQKSRFLYRLRRSLGKCIRRAIRFN